MERVDKIFNDKFFCAVLMLALSAQTVHSKVAVTQQTESRTKDPPAFLGNYLIEDKCQFDLCGRSYAAEFGGQEPVAGSCSGDCSLLAVTLNQNKFHKEFLWSACSEMCGEKYPADQHPEYKNRFLCMESCYSSYNKISPHHNVARYCMQAACSTRGTNTDIGFKIDCFSGCADHVSETVPESNWRVWARAIAGTCSTTNLTSTDILNQRLKCADGEVWEHISKVEKQAEEQHSVHCLEVVCKSHVKCAHQCLNHIHSLDHKKRTEWMECSVTEDCSEMTGWAARQECADQCQHRRHQLREQARLNQLSKEAARTQLHLYSNSAPHLLPATWTCAAILFLSKFV